MKWENHEKEKLFFVCGKILIKTKSCWNWVENLFSELGYLISREGLITLLCSVPPSFFLSCFLSITSFVISLVNSFLVLDIWICIFVCTISRVWLIHKTSPTECRKLAGKAVKTAARRWRLWQLLAYFKHLESLMGSLRIWISWLCWLHSVTGKCLCKAFKPSVG